MSEIKQRYLFSSVALSVSLYLFYFLFMLQKLSRITGNILITSIGQKVAVCIYGVENILVLFFVGFFFFFGISFIQHSVFKTKTK